MPLWSAGHCDGWIATRSPYDGRASDRHSQGAGRHATRLRPREFKDAAYRADQRRRAVLSPMAPLAQVDGIGASRPRARWHGRWRRKTAWQPGQYVVELGGGTGAITQGLIERGIPRDRLIVIELDGALHAYLKERLHRLSTSSRAMLPAWTKSWRARHGVKSCDGHLRDCRWSGMPRSSSGRSSSRASR